MTDNRTPEQLGEALAEKMTEKHNAEAWPQVFIMSNSFECFCKGRGFTDLQRIECEKAYQRRHKELNQ